MIRTLLFSAFVASIFFAPWWVSVALGIALMSYFEAYLSVLAGMLLLDALFGVPTPAFFGVAYLYTSVFIALALLAVLLRGRLLG